MVEPQLNEYIYNGLNIDPNHYGLKGVVQKYLYGQGNKNNWNFGMGDLVYVIFDCWQYTHSL